MSFGTFSRGLWRFAPCGRVSRLLREGESWKNSNCIGVDAFLQRDDPGNPCPGNQPRASSNSALFVLNLSVTMGDDCRTTRSGHFIRFPQAVVLVAGTDIE